MTIQRDICQHSEHAEAKSDSGEKEWVKPQPFDYSDQSRGWDSSARVYEWDGEEGDVGPEFPELEMELFGLPEHRAEVKGIDFSECVTSHLGL